MVSTLRNIICLSASVPDRYRTAKSTSIVRKTTDKQSPVRCEIYHNFWWCCYLSWKPKCDIKALQSKRACRAKRPLKIRLKAINTSESRDTHELRSTDEFSKFIETFSAFSTIAISPKLEQQKLHRVLYDSHAGELRSCQFFLPEVKAIGQAHFLLNHTLVLIAPPFLMTSRMVDEEA